MNGLADVLKADFLQKALLFQFVFKYREARVQEIANRLARCRVNLKATGIWELCEQWTARGWLKCRQQTKTKGSCIYSLVQNAEFPVLQELAILGEANHWWKEEYSWYSANRNVLFRSLLAGGKAVASALEKLEWDQSQQWEEAAHYVATAKTVHPFPLSRLPADVPDRFYRILGSLCLAEGADFSGLLRDWRQHHLDAKPFDAASDAIEFMAQCVLAGHVDWTKGVAVKGDMSPVKMFKDICQALVTGDLAGASAASTQLLAYRFCDERRYERKMLFGLLATNLLFLLITVFHKPAMTRVKTLVSRLCPYTNCSNGQNSAPVEMKKCVEQRLSVFWDSLTFSNAFWYDVPDPDYRLPVSSVSLAVRSLVQAVDRANVAKLAEELLVAAESAVRDQAPTLAGVILSVFGWAFEGEKKTRMEAVAQAVTAAGGVWFRPFDLAGQVPWKRVVAAFAERLPATVKTNVSTTTTKKGRIFWALRMSLAERETGDAERLDKILSAPVGTILSCWSIDPYYRGPRGADDCRNDKSVTFRSIRSGKYDACLSESDRAVLAVIEKERAETACGSLPTAVLESLASMDNVLVRAFDQKNKDLILAPLTLKRKTVPLTVASRADGGVDLAVPTWSVGTESDRRLVYEGNGVVSLVPLGKQMKGILDVFREFGSKAKVSIPKEGMEAMRPLMGRLGGLFPIQGELEAMGEGTGLARIEGDAKPLVRLEFANDELTIQLKVRPFQAAAELLFTPGEGQPERIVNSKGQTFAVVRDLAAERERAAVVRTALANYSDWSTGTDMWCIGSLEEALGALVALKELGDALAMEWRGGEKLKVASFKTGGGSWHVGEGTADRWFSIQGDFAFDDGKVLSVMRLVEALANRVGDFVHFGEGEYLKLTGELAKRLEALASVGQKKKNALDVPPSALPLLARAFESDGENLPKLLQTRADEWRRIVSSPVDVPRQLRAQLRPYQEEGFVWLARLAACGFGACLADDMGLGKTLQAIALLLARSNDGPSLVVAPASVCGNWRREIARFAPTLKTTLGWEWTPEMPLAGGDIVVASYGILVSRAEAFAAVDWNGVVLDEAQAIKNDTAKRSKTVRELRAKFRVVATGTPVENRLEELWSIFEFLNPGLLGPLSSFLTRLSCNGRATPALKRLVAPFILRRLKRDVLVDLPPKTEITIPVELDEAERTAYEGCRRHALEVLSAGAEESRISILAELTRLRRFCCHPSLVLPDFSTSAKLEMLTSLLSDLRSNGHRALVFSQFTDYLAIVRRMLESNGWSYRYLDGTTPQKERDAAVDAFQKGEGDFFLISLKAGGMGLNLTAANYVVLLDPWWNPAVENQAADRVHRIGQKDPVTIYRLIAADTVEERVLDLHAQKQEMAEDVLDGTSTTTLTPEVLMGLFR